MLPQHSHYGPFMLPQHSLVASSALPPVDCYLLSLFMTSVVSGILWFPSFRDSRLFPCDRHWLEALILLSASLVLVLYLHISSMELLFWPQAWAWEKYLTFMASSLPPGALTSTSPFCHSTSRICTFMRCSNVERGSTPPHICHIIVRLFVWARMLCLGLSPNIFCHILMLLYRPHVWLL